MIGLGELEADLWQGRYHRLADSHVHRAVREDSLGVIKGRDAIIASWIAEDGLVGQVMDQIGDMVIVGASDAGRQQAGDWRLHRWVWREDGRILREVEVTNRERALVAPPAHRPLGELDAGRGQYAASAEPDFPPGFPAAARTFAVAVHRQWNARDFSAPIPPEMRSLIRALPDARVFFEHAAVSERGIALLLRIMGHHATGQRIRLIGSMTIIDGASEYVIDMAAYQAQLTRPMIDYGAQNHNLSQG